MPTMVTLTRFLRGKNDGPPVCGQKAQCISVLLWGKMGYIVQSGRFALEMNKRAFHFPPSG